MLIPSFSTASAGGTLTAALWNSNVRDAGNFFLAVPQVILTQSSAVQAAANVTFINVLWDTEVRDNDATHSTVTNTSRITIVTAGYYTISGTAGWAGSAAGQRISRWAVNGTAVAGTETCANAALATTSAYRCTSTDLFLNVGDYLEMQIWQNSGGSLNTNIGSSTNSRCAVRWTGQ